MLKNMKVRFSLIIGYAITTIVSLLIIITSLVMLNAHQNNFEDIIDTDAHANELILYIRLNTNIMARNVREIALFPSTSESKRLHADIEETRDELESQMNELQAIDPLNDNSVEQYIASVKDWDAAVQKILNLLDTGRVEEAIRLINSDCIPRLKAMGDHAVQADNALVAHQDARVAAQARSNTISIVVIAVAVVISVALVGVLAHKIIRSIVVPVHEVHAALVGFSEGKMDIPVNYESDNELGEMCTALRSSQGTLSEVIQDICNLLEEMAKGNFDIRSRNADLYVGELSTVIHSIQGINFGLSDALHQIRLSSDQVAAGADQVSTGAQSLAQGATEQASAVEELSATIADISNNAQKNAQNSELGMEHAKAAGAQVEESARYMEEMVEAMGKISDSSEEIRKIIATIENIAFQTNILALNAAVEAARAGAAGKGFAVVADEVRNLASKSDQAAKATKELIEHSVDSVKDGNEIVKHVSDSLEKTVELAKQVLNDVQLISNAAEEESESISQITEGIDQISSVVQTNSATSEESAATSKELENQVVSLKRLVARFRLK